MKRVCVGGGAGCCGGVNEVVGWWGDGYGSDVAATWVVVADAVCMDGRVATLSWARHLLGVVAATCVYMLHCLKPWTCLANKVINTTSENDLAFWTTLRPRAVDKARTSNRAPIPN